MYWTDGHTDILFLHENPQFLGAKGTTKKAEALELFVYPNSKGKDPNNTPFPWFCVAATHTKTPSKKKGQEIRSQVPPATHVSQPRCCPPRPSPAVSATCRLHGSRLRSGCSADSKRKGLLRTTTPHHYDSALRPVNVLVRYVQFRGY